MDPKKYVMNLQVKGDRIVANFGVSQVESSVINCILMNSNETNSLMIGSMGQQEEKTFCILKNGGGISPAISFIVFLSRKYYN